MRTAYREPERPTPRNTRLQHTWFQRLPRMAAAAVMIFALGTLTGTLLPSKLPDTSSQMMSSLAEVDQAHPDLKRVVLHISSTEAQQLDKALTDAENLLSHYQDHPELVQLEVVANAEGLALLRTDTSAYPERIRKLAEKFSNVSFLACSRTIEKLRLRGIDVHLLPEAELIPSALDAIVDRLQKGWIYIRV